jgi:hypothetical protein
MSAALSHRRPPCNRQGVLHDHEGEGKWRRVTGDLVAWPAVGEAGMAVEVGGTGGAIGSTWREGERDSRMAAWTERFPQAGWICPYGDFLFFIKGS